MAEDVTKITGKDLYRILVETGWGSAEMARRTGVDRQRILDALQDKETLTVSEVKLILAARKAGD